MMSILVFRSCVSKSVISILSLCPRTAQGMKISFTLICVLLTLVDHIFLPFRRHAQSLAALQAYSHWLAQYCSEAHRQNTQQFVTLVSTTMDAITPLISTKVLRPFI
jgi:hypothetical protein